MTNIQYVSEALQQYRKKGAEIAELRNELNRKIGSLEPSEAQKEFDRFVVRTEEFEQLRAQLEPKDLFMAKYGVIVINDHTVSFVLPKGCSRIEMLQEASELANAAGLLDRWVLASWSVQERFTEVATESERICIDGHVEGMDSKTRKEQTSFLSGKGLVMPSLEDLAVAFALHWVATGEPLFGWMNDSWTSSYEIRAESGALAFINSTPLSIAGLISCGDRDDEGWYWLGASARVPLELALQPPAVEPSTHRSGYYKALRGLFGWLGFPGEQT
jgi:hypothetical protein